MLKCVLERVHLRAFLAKYLEKQVMVGKNTEVSELRSPILYCVAARLSRDARVNGMHWGYLEQSLRATVADNCIIYSLYSHRCGMATALD